MAFFKLAHLKLDQPEMHKCMQIFFFKKKKKINKKSNLMIYYVDEYELMEAISNASWT